MSAHGGNGSADGFILSALVVDSQAGNEASGALGECIEVYTNR